jgi:protein-S-isoprenylcysteine O-methyltransferase Ste14
MKNVLTKALLAGVAEMTLFAVLLFASAGTVRWIGAWAFIVIMLALIVIVSLMLAEHDPDLLKERLALPLQSGQKGWDKILMVALLVLFIAWMPLMGLDAIRYQWSHVPVWLQFAGATGLIVSFYFCYLVFGANSYLLPVVRIQEDRGQHVVSSGPYRFVRHPLYASSLILLPSIALLLGSGWGLVWSVLLAALIVIRTDLEDATLAKELAGYADYATKVRYRLIPGVW